MGGHVEESPAVDLKSNQTKIALMIMSHSMGKGTLVQNESKILVLIKYDHDRKTRHTIMTCFPVMIILY